VCGMDAEVLTACPSVAIQAHDVKKQIALQNAIKFNGGGEPPSYTPLGLPLTLLLGTQDTSTTFVFERARHRRDLPANLPLMSRQSFFWETLTPPATSAAPTSGPLFEAIKADFGGLDGLKKAVNAAALGIQGSGWAWLGVNPATKKLEAVATANQDPLLAFTPIIGIDLWE
jgi:hypothetical protein